MGLEHELLSGVRVARTLSAKAGGQMSVRKYTDADRQTGQVDGQRPEFLP